MNKLGTHRDTEENSDYQYKSKKKADRRKAQTEQEDITWLLMRRNSTLSTVKATKQKRKRRIKS